MTQFQAYLIRGYSLIEVMIAVFVLSVGIIAISSMQTTSVNSADNARQTIIDSVAAGTNLEQILALPYNDALLKDADGAYLVQSPDHGPFSLTGNRGTIEWEVGDDFLSAHAKRITVTVRRLGRGGRLHRVRYNYIKVLGYAP